MTTQETILLAIQKNQEAIALLQTILEAPTTWSPVTASKAASMTLDELVFAADQKQNITGIPHQFASEFANDEAFIEHLIGYITC